MTFFSFLFFVLALAVAVWTALVWRGFTQTWMPEELKGAKLVLVEKNLWTDATFPVVGRPDRVYRLATGDHVPLENKNRDGHAVYETDIAQLSLQAWLLRQTGKATAAFGYVVINSRRTGQRKSIRVDLYGDTACEQIIQRYFDITEGRTVPRKSRGGKCKSCGHRQHCHEN